MGSLKADEDDKKELDDSGYVQDEAPHKSSLEKKCINLLDLSDDVLLCILKLCRPADLKALAFSHARLASLARSRSLWQLVDARSSPSGPARLRWLLASLHDRTTTLLLRGFAEETQHCNGYQNVNRPPCLGGAKKDGHTDRPHANHNWAGLHDSRHPDMSRVTILWPEEELQKKRVNTSKAGADLNGTGTDSSKLGHDPHCAGPVFPVSPCTLRQIRSLCPALTELALEYCDINCARISLAQFPRQLKRLSLRGTSCYNMSLNKSILFMIQDHLPDLEFIDVSHCHWLDASCLLPLSKLTNLRHLAAAFCSRLREFVAYASLSARYGFLKLQIFDLRGSPVGDSEAAAFGWLPELQELYLSSEKCETISKAKHNHFADDPLPFAKELDDWEMQEPEYFKELLKLKKKSGKHKLDESERCLHGLPFHLCKDGLDETSTKKSSRDLKRSAHKNSDEPGPSKRKRQSHSDDDDDESTDEETNGDEANNGDETNNENVNGDQNVEGNLNANENVVIEVRPRAHVLFVNVGQQLNPVHRIVNYDINNAPEVQNYAPDYLDAYNLISDNSIRSFGHSDDDNINYFHIGGPPNAHQSRPNKSNLRILSLVGYKKITDRSLEHLRTSAPKLKIIDFRNTSVTERGVELFKITRPDVDIKYSPFVENEVLYNDLVDVYRNVSD